MRSVGMKDKRVRKDAREKVSSVKKGKTPYIDILSTNMSRKKCRVFREL